MTGPEHYRKAEALLNDRSTYENVERASVRIAAAQVHATLALAAATAGASPGWQPTINGPPRSARPKPQQPAQTPSPSGYGYTSLRKERAEQRRRQGLDTDTDM